MLTLFFLYTAVRPSSIPFVRFDHIWWGDDDDDVARHIEIPLTKSGRKVAIALSRRLRRHRGDEWIRRGQPDGRIFPHFDESNALKRLADL